MSLLFKIVTIGVQYYSLEKPKHFEKTKKSKKYLEILKFEYHLKIWINLKISKISKNQKFRKIAKVAKFKKIKNFEKL